MRRFLALFLIVFALCTAPMQSAFARPTVAALTQPMLVEVDKRLVPLAQATTKAQLKLKGKFLTARAVLVSAGAATNDLTALALLKTFAGKLALAAPKDPDFAVLFAATLDGFDGVVAELRTDLAARIARLAVPAPFTKSLAKLDVLIAAAKKPGLTLVPRAVKLAAAFVGARAVDKALAKCPGMSGPDGHGQFSALVDTVLFAPKNAAANLYVDSAGSPLSLHIDGYRFPYDQGAIGMTIPQSALGLHTAVLYDHATGNLVGDYLKDGVYHGMQSGTLTLTEFDPVGKRIAGSFSFQGRDAASGTQVVVESGSFTICGFRVTVVQ